MDIEKIQQLINILSESQLNELELFEGDCRLWISKSTRGQRAAPVISEPQVFQPESGPEPASVPVSAAARKEPEDFKVTSPMVGTFYRARTPQDKPFVEVGSVVSVGDTLAVVEAMKMLNEITAEKSGTIKAVLCENGVLVDYGAPLFAIE
ncbi:acetyl-CoA carboxylase biotin carboxyl carrier protein subunit [Caballeronia glebae]|uniref:Biotin carboxyl carrier protein of acetyl-CoA carboxylase n=1 Tax=Caballeronia glebae TaxID=1777143 RepID=A0A158AZV6_9BURK|nr:acetyl-CoA carboxylase biotin carboxyl carrier protein [Caballeronia glebae]SAK63249.1 acetyl-CoA carboxylase biotin carboxyl carrier protein subunit [Caballeronia glebae]